MVGGMARKLRLQLPGALYHLTSRGDRQEEIFRDDSDRTSFLQALADVCARTAWRVHAYCLLPNHFHLVIETPQPNLVAGMKWLLGTYTARFNRRHGLSGHVFAGRYRSQLIDPSSDFLRLVCDYVHLNPDRSGILDRDTPLETYPWSSLQQILAPASARPAWLSTDRLFTQADVSDTDEGRHQFAKGLNDLRQDGADSKWETVREGWCLGTDGFRTTMLTHVSAGAGENHFGAELNEAAEAKAMEIVAEELQRLQWDESELTRRRKGDPAKIAVALRLRAETTVTLQWIADRLHMGTKTHLSHLLYWTRRDERDQDLPSRSIATRPSFLRRIETASQSNPQQVVRHKTRASIENTPRQRSSDRPATRARVAPKVTSKDAPIPSPNPAPRPANSTISLPRPDPFEFDTSFD